MPNAASKWTDQDRIRALAEYAILDTPPEAEFDDIVEMAARACDAPMAVISLMDADRQWFKAEVGIGLREIPLNLSVCVATLDDTELLLVRDALEDERFVQHPFVTGPPQIRFYAGVPLLTGEGIPIGTLCVLDHRPRELTDQQIFIIRALARTVMAQLESRRALRGREAARAAQRRSEARNRQILDSATDFAIIATGLDKRVTSWNRGAVNIFGWTEEEMLGDTVERIFTPEDQTSERAETEMQCALEQGAASDERWHRRKNGERFWASGEMMPLRDEQGAAIGFVKILRDRTEQHRAGLREKAAAAELRAANDAQLKATQEWRRAMYVVEQSSDFIGMAGADGRTIFINEAGRRMVGLGSAASVESRSVIDCFVPEDREYATRVILPAVMAEGRWVGDLRFANVHTGTITPVHYLVFAVRDDTGAFMGTAAIARDITAAKETEAKLLQLNETLEERVEARTRELQLTEEHLRQSQKMEAVGQLTGGIAHDFNNLLQGIIGPLELLKRYVSLGRTADLGRFVNMAMTSADRAAALTHRLLAFSRRQPLAPKPVEVNALLAAMEDLLRRTSGESIRIEMVLPAGLWTPQCDANQLENAVLNLAINARDAMPDGGTLTIATRNVHLGRDNGARHAGVEPGDYVAVSVSDTGTGMPADVLERAFDPFYTTKPMGEGTGLGLSMIYGFARQSQGHAKIESEVGKGSTVEIFLPRFKGTPQDQPVLPQVDQACRSGNGETVLVLEDEQVVRELVTEVLADMDYRVLYAADGATGLEILRSAAKIDLLITDVGLPGLNGRQVADAARALRPGLKVLFMTGYAENAKGSGFLERGMEMITKPFTVETIVARIRDILKAP